MIAQRFRGAFIVVVHAIARAARLCMQSRVQPASHQRVATKRESAAASHFSRACSRAATSFVKVLHEDLLLDN